MIRAALFDLGGVLFKLDLDGVCKRWEQRLRMTPQQILNAMYGGNDDKALIGVVPEDDWWDVVAERLGLDRTERDRFIADLGFCEKIDEQLGRFIAGLRPRLRTAFVSNAWSNTRQYLRERGVLDLVDQLVCSAEVGVAKPDRRIFEIALERLGVQPEEAVFVDDAEDHVEAARALGIHAILHRSSSDTIAAVKALLG